VQGCTTKCVLKTALRGIVLERTLRKPKHGFTVPLNERFRVRLRDFASGVLLDDDRHSSGYLNLESVRVLLERHMERKDNFGIQLWTLLNSYSIGGS